MDSGSLYEAPFTSLHAGGPEELFQGKDNVINGIFKTLEQLQPQIESGAA
jgi:type I restriction enzyme, R subunit